MQCECLDVGALVKHSNNLIPFVKIKISDGFPDTFEIILLIQL